MSAFGLKSTNELMQTVDHAPIPINHIGQSSPIEVRVFFAISKLAIPLTAFFLWAKYVGGSVSTISTPKANRLSAYAILNPQKSLNIASTLPNWASICTRLEPKDFAKSECHRVSRVVDVRHRLRLFSNFKAFSD